MKSLRRLAKHVAYAAMPQVAADLDERIWLSRKVRELANRTKKCCAPADYIAAVRATDAFVPWQNDRELEQLLEMVQKLRPQRLCEIGSADGGTLFLFSQLAADNALIVSMDIKYSPAKLSSFPKFATGGKRVLCIEGDSHHVESKHRLQELLAGQPLDFLFIDGDHSYDGVANDFELYSPLVRPGGLIAFHDIVPDNLTTTGQRSSSYSGEVPRFWKDVKSRFQDCTELVEDWSQDGFGIGVVRWPGALL